MLSSVAGTAAIPEISLAWTEHSIAKLRDELIAAHGDSQRLRIQRGLLQVARFWRADDGDAATFEDFVRTHFAGDQPTLDAMFSRLEHLLEHLSGYMHEMNREFRQQLDLDLGPVLAIDEIIGGYDPSAHVIDDFFQNKLAFVVLLNFPVTSLAERLTDARLWSRRQWAEVRLAQSFSKRIPAEVNLARAQAEAETGQYVSKYNIWMHHVLNAQGQRLFPPKMRLLSHWNLRDEIKASYTDSSTGLEKQRVIQQVMEQIVNQSIPAVVINNPAVDWNPFTREIAPAAVKDYDRAAARSNSNAAREPDTRYAMLQKTFFAARKADPYSPAAPTLIARRFDENREIPEPRVRAMLEQVVSSPLVPRLANLIQSRLGRRLEPFDIWYSGFRPGSQYSETQLDEMVARRYPTAQAYQQDIPQLLIKLGFSRERAQYLAANIAVDPARGAGHAMGAEMRGQKAHLRTRVEANGMNYKSFNVAAHELGHNVEQTFSLNGVDHIFLKGVPNTAFTEAFAFVFQSHDLELLGLPAPNAKQEAEKTLNDFWATYEISGVALVDMAVWHWMYDHSHASPEELRHATLQISKDVWNKYYAPVFGKEDVVLLGVYSHMVDAFLYLPDYPIGHLIAFQIEEQMKKAGSIGPEFERMVKIGSVAPDLWMENATGRPVEADALLEAAQRSFDVVTNAADH